MGLEEKLGERISRRGKLAAISGAVLLVIGGGWGLTRSDSSEKAIPDGFEVNLGMSEDSVKSSRPFAKGTFPAKEDLGEAARERVREYLFGTVDTPPYVNPNNVEYYFKEGKLGGVVFNGKKFSDGECTLTGERVLARVKEEKGGKVMGKSQKEFILYKEAGDSFAIYSFSSSGRGGCRFRYNVLHKSFMKAGDLKLLGASFVEEDLDAGDDEKSKIKSYVAKWKEKVVEERYGMAREFFRLEKEIVTYFKDDADDFFVEVGWIKQGDRLYLDHELSDKTQVAIKYVHSLLKQDDELLEPEEKDAKRLLSSGGAIYLGRGEGEYFFALDARPGLVELAVKMGDKVEGVILNRK